MSLFSGLVTSEEMRKGVCPEVVLAGACNMIGPTGDHLRNAGRDELAAWLCQIGRYYFEVQVHPQTHGREYDYAVDGPAEKKARKEAKLRVYEIRPDVMSSVTMMEILDDARHGRFSIVWFHGGTDFVPNGLGSRNQVRDNKDLAEQVGEVLHAHLVTYVSAGRQIRAELRAMLSDAPTIKIVDGDLDAVKKTIWSLLD